MAIDEERELDDPGCCSIDYSHHKAVFERRREVYREDPSKAVTVHEACIRLVNDHLKEAKTSEGYTILCDEPESRGGTGKGAAPLQYFVASIGF